jgi:L-ascorbate metabolism protein UlaG (beta-lactamase superfamily)
VTSLNELAWLGHSTVVLELDGTRVITDPVLTRRVAHLWRAGPLPPFDCRFDLVAVSHVHWDHLHVPSLARVAAGAVLVVPAGSERLAASLGYAEVVGVRRGDTVRVGGLEVRVTHAEHPGSRRAGRHAEAVGYIFRGSRGVYFAGDTDLFDGMREFGDLDVALLPIAGWGRTLSAGHLDARGAVEALELLRPRSVIPIHWGTFAPLGLRVLGASDTAVDVFKTEAAKRVPEVAVHVLRVGAVLAL